MERLDELEELETIISDNARDDEWDTFVRSIGGSHYTQSSLWAQVREVQGWRSYRIYLKQDGVILTGAQLLIRPVKMIGWVGYVPQGILSKVCDIEKEVLLLRAFQETCKKNKIHFMALPYWSRKGPNTLDLEQYGFLRSIIGDIDTPCTNIVDLTPPVEDILEGMDRNKRNQIRASQKRGLIFREGDRTNIETFYRLHNLDADRLGYVPFKIDFFYRLWDLYAPRGLGKMFLTEFEGEIVNAAVFIQHRDTLYAYKIGWSGNERNRYPNEAIHFGAMLWAKEQGMKTYDFGGFETRALEVVQKGKPYPEWFKKSYAYFKYQMGKSLVIQPPMYDYIPNSINRWCYKTIIPVLRSSHQYGRLVRFFKGTISQPGPGHANNQS